MSGLLIKDFYTIVKQLRLVLIFLVIMVAIPGINQSAFAMIYFAMMPITVMAYDERCKWDSLAATMPYSSRNIVLSKYLLGYIGMGAVSLLSLAAHFVIKRIQHGTLTMEEMLAVPLIACVALTLLAINLPFIFWMGVEKGRIIFMLLIATTVFSMMMVGDQVKQVLAANTMSPSLLLGLAVAITLLVNLISIAISNAVYVRKTY